MRARQLAIVLPVLFLGTGLAVAGAPKTSCVKVVTRASTAIAALARSGLSVQRAESGLIAKGKKCSFSRELDAGEYCLFAVSEEAAGMEIDITAFDAGGKAIKAAKGVGEAFLQSFTTEKKETCKLEIECGDATNNDPAHYILCLLAKKEGQVASSEMLFERAIERAKAIEDAGYEVQDLVIDTLSKPWVLTRKLDAASWVADTAADDDSVKEMDLEIQDSTGKSLAKKEKPKDDAKWSANVKHEVKAAGEHKLAVSATFQEGQKEGLVAVMTGKKK
jgi:hypothetical protein